MSKIGYYTLFQGNLANRVKINARVHRQRIVLYDHRFHSYKI